MSYERLYLFGRHLAITDDLETYGDAFFISTELWSGIQIDQLDLTDLWECLECFGDRAVGSIFGYYETDISPDYLVLEGLVGYTTFRTLDDRTHGREVEFCGDDLVIVSDPDE